MQTRFTQNVCKTRKTLVFEKKFFFKKSFRVNQKWLSRNASLVSTKIRFPRLKIGFCSDEKLYQLFTKAKKLNNAILDAVAELIHPELKHDDLKIKNFAAILQSGQHRRIQNKLFVQKKQFIRQ